MNASPLDKFYHWEKTTPEGILFRQPIQGQWREYTFEQAGKETRIIASALKALGLPTGSKIAILSKNCAHWIMADFAIWMTGHVSVPLYPTLTAPSIRQILEHSEAKVIFVGKLDDYKNQSEGIPNSIRKISFPFYGPEEGTQWNDLLNIHPPLAENTNGDPEALVTIMYTSGTTGVPKGVMFNFNQLMWTASAAVKSLQDQVGLPLHARLFSYLPLSHIAERMITELTGIALGASITFVDSLDTFAATLAETQPHLFFGVPRIYMKFQEKILEKLPQKKLSTLLKIPFFNLVLRNKVKKTLGLKEAKVIASGAAPIPVSLIRWYNTLGIAIREVYGMTENEGFCTFNLNAVKVGSVGQPWPGVQVNLDGQGEIMSKHPGTMMGYYKEPQMTAAMFTEDGFLKTGDLGVFDPQGFLTITGRTKDIFKTDKGKYVAPAPIEMRLLTNPDIDQVCVVGMGIPQPIALVILSASGKARSKEEIINSISATVRQTNQLLESYEKLQAVVILKKDWTIENGLMTPTLKVKRNEVERIFLPNYPKWYEAGQVVVWE